MPFVSEWDVKALFNRYTIYIASLPEGTPWRAGSRTRHITTVAITTARNPFGQPARHYLMTNPWADIILFSAICCWKYYYYVLKIFSCFVAMLHKSLAVWRLLVCVKSSLACIRLVLEFLTKDYCNLMNKTPKTFNMLLLISGVN